MLRQPVHKYYNCLLCCTQKKLQPCFCPTFEISCTMYLKGYKSYTVDPGVMLTSLVRLHCLSVYFIRRLIILNYAVCLSNKWEDLRMNLTLVSSVQVTPSCVTGGAWEWSCLRCWWDSHPSWPQRLQRLRSRSVKKKNTVHFDRNWLQWGSCLKDRCHSSCITDMAGHYLPDWGHRPQCLFLLDVESFDSIHRRLLTLLYSWIRKRRTHFIQQLSTNTSSVCVLPKQEISCRKQNKPSTRKINYNWHKCLMYIICYIHYTIYGYILSIKTYISIIKVNIKKWPHGSCCLPPPVLLSCFLRLWLTSIADNG